MKTIDFINDTDYIPQDDFKIVVIDLNGDTYIADTNNDGKEFPFTFPQKMYDHHKLNVHTDYFYLLFSKYLKEYPELFAAAKEANIYQILLQAIKHGLIIINNITSYTGPLYQLYGKRIEVMVPMEITPQELEALSSLRYIFENFKEVSVRTCTPNLETHSIITDQGTKSIDAYLNNNGVNMSNKVH